MEWKEREKTHLVSRVDETANVYKEPASGDGRGLEAAVVAQVNGEFARGNLGVDAKKTILVPDLHEKHGVWIVTLDQHKPAALSAKYALHMGLMGDERGRKGTKGDERGRKGTKERKRRGAETHCSSSGVSES